MRNETKTPKKLTTDDVLSLVDDVLGQNPWVRFGVSGAVGFLIGIAGGRVVKAGARLALAAGARHLAGYAFDAAFDAGNRDGGRFAGRRRPTWDQAAERSY